MKKFLSAFLIFSFMMTFAGRAECAAPAVKCFNGTFVGADENGVDDFIKRRENEPNEDEEANPTRVIVTIAALIAVLLGLLLYLGNL